MPSALGDLAALSRLSVGFNRLTGRIPASFASLVSLASLDLGYNELSGEIPPALGSVASLENLILSDNALTGEILRELGSLKRLESLWMQDNDLEGAIPRELGRLHRLTGLGLDGNHLTGEIPRELGNLSELVRLDLSGNDLTGSVPDEFGSLAAIRSLDVDHNRLGGELPESLMRLDIVERLHFQGQALCAPVDADFQDWLGAIDDAAGPNCISFARTIDDKAYTKGVEIASTTLPLAAGGAPPLVYALSPELPAGLAFDPDARVLSGTPSDIFQRTDFMYEARDPHGLAGALTFSVEVTGPTSTVDAGPELPATFALRGNYPNPFNSSTTVIFDLPAPALVSIEVIDLVGRLRTTTHARPVEAGYNRRLDLDLGGAPSGTYLYRIRAEAETLIASGKMTLFR